MRLAELVATLSLATDLGSGQPMERSLRRCLLAIRLGAAARLDDEQMQTAYYSSLLQYVGCAAGEPGEAILAILRLHGAGEPIVRRARMLAAALARMPSQPRILEAHCEVCELGFENRARVNRVHAAPA